MAGKNVDEIVVGANGSVRVAPLDTAFPANATAAAGAGWLDLGYMNEDGVKTTDGKSIEDIKVWQQFYVARKIVTEREFSIAFVMRQWSASTFPLAFGGGDVVPIDGYAGQYRYAPPPPEELDERAMMVDWIDGTRQYRLCIPRGMVSENVETQIVRSGAADLPITFTVIGTEDQDPWYLLTNDPAFAGS